MSCEPKNSVVANTQPMSIDQLREFAQKIASDPTYVEEIDYSTASEVRKYLNPLGNVITGKKTYANISLVNYEEQYLKKLHTTAMIGYLYRTLEEYEPEDELRDEVKRYENALKTSGVSESDLKSEHAVRMKLIKSTSQAIVRKFLNRNFDYNPDKHLRASHTENKADPERVGKFEAIKRQCDVSATAPTIEAKLASKPDATFAYMRSQLLATYQAAVETTAVTKAVLGVILDPTTDLADKQGILIKKYKQLASVTADLKKIAEPLAAADTLSAWSVDPPVDVFHQFDRYLTNHYEQLRDVVTALYNEKADFEYAVILHGTFKTAESAKEYRVQHESEFKTDVLTIENSCVTLVGPFKENRERVDFYNKNTEIMKRMMEQLESDHKLGKDLMEKQVKSQKSKNIAEAGPDAAGLANYSKNMNIVQELGGRKILSKEDADKLAEAKSAADAIKEDYEVPDNAIQVDILFPQSDADGNVTGLGKSKFYTAAEAPLHMQEGSETDKYQPKREDGKSLESSYKTKVIVSKTGEKRVIQVPKDIKK